MTSEQMSDHLEIDRYGDFTLTEAIRPAPNLPVIPRQGYRSTIYRDPASGRQVPVLVAAVSQEVLFDVFLALLPPLGETVDVVLETSHNSFGANHKDLHRDHIDMPVLMSYCCDFEDLLLNDGCTGLAVVSPENAMEVQFDEHKLLIVYARDLEPFESILEEHGVTEDSSLQLIIEGEHMHSTADRHMRAFEQLCYRMGVAERAELLSW